jgi:anti-anti-sigma factor
MKRHLTASAVSMDRGSESDARASVVDHPRGTPNMKETPTLAPSGEPSLVLASLKTWTHTLILTGELNIRSAQTLEAEIERLCEQGVTGITLDLRQLAYIDPIGVAVIGFCCGLCKRRGYDIALIRGSGAVHRVFEQAGVTAFLPFRQEEIVASSGRLGVRPLSRRLRAESAVGHS